MITNLSVSRALAQGKLVVSVDESRPPADPFKLPAALLTLIETDITTLESDDSGSHQAEGDRIEASGTARAAFDNLEAALRFCYNGITAIPGSDLLPSGITDADRLGVFTTYGWAKGQLGRFTDERLLVLGELAVQGATTIANPAWRYASAFTTIIQAQLDLIESEEPASTTGSRQVSIASRLASRDLLETHLSRARYHYCASSDDLDTTKELARIAFQPRRPKGSGASAPAVTPAPAVP